MDKHELGRFLRTRRERLRPSDVGLPTAARRRTPGLRREEVAVMAHISTEYYIRLEQGRAPRPSGEVLSGVAEALRLTDSEGHHLHVLAGTVPAGSARHRRDVCPSVHALLDRLPGTAAIAISAACEVLAWNDLAVALLEDFAPLPATERNLARRAFRAFDAGGTLYGATDGTGFLHHVVMQLVAATARYPDDPGVVELVEELREGNTEFARLWARRDIAPARTLTKSFRHPSVGVVTVDCHTLVLPDRDQHLVLYTAAPGSRDAEALDLLAVLGPTAHDRTRIGAPAAREARP